MTPVWQLPHTADDHHKPAQGNIGSPFSDSQVSVILPASPTASANRTAGMRQRWCGAAAQRRQNAPSLSTGALLTGLGLRGWPIFPFSTIGKPQGIGDLRDRRGRRDGLGGDGTI